MMRRRTGDRGGDDIAGPHLEVAGTKVHQTAIAGPTCHPHGGDIFAAFTTGHQKFDGTADESLVLLKGDRFLKIDQAFIDRSSGSDLL